jgi:hypothetical protein
MSKAIFAVIALTLVTAAVAVGCGGDADKTTTPEPRPATVAADRTMAKLERIVRERVDSNRSTGIVAGVVFPDGGTRVVAYLRPATPANPYADYSVEQLYDFLSSYKPTRDAGSEFEDSNLGVGLLGHVLALRAGKSYEELLRERILEPLGMRMSGITLTPEMKRHFASGHDARGKVVPPWDLPTLAGAGALRSSVADMLRFAAANLEGDAGTLEGTMAATHAPRHTIDPRVRIGLNWFIVRARDREMSGTTARRPASPASSGSTRHAAERSSCSATRQRPASTTSGSTSWTSGCPWRPRRRCERRSRFRPRCSSATSAPTSSRA